MPVWAKQATQMKVMRAWWGQRPPCYRCYPRNQGMEHRPKAALFKRSQKPLLVENFQFLNVGNLTHTHCADLTERPWESDTTGGYLHLHPHRPSQVRAQPLGRASDWPPEHPKSHGRAAPSPSRFFLFLPPLAASLAGPRRHRRPLLPCEAGSAPLNSTRLRSMLKPCSDSSFTAQGDHALSLP